MSYSAAAGKVCSVTEKGYLPGSGWEAALRIKPCCLKRISALRRSWVPQMDPKDLEVASQRHVDSKMAACVIEIYMLTTMESDFSNSVT